MTVTTFWEQYKGRCHQTLQDILVFINLYKMQALSLILFTPLFIAIPLFFLESMFLTVTSYGFIFFLIMILMAIPWVVLPMFFLFTFEELSRPIQLVWSVIVLFSAIFWGVVFAHWNFHL